MNSIKRALLLLLLLPSLALAQATSYNTYTEAVAAGQAVTNHPPFIITKSVGTSRTFWTVERLKTVASDPLSTFTLETDVELQVQDDGSWSRIRPAYDATDIATTNAPDGNGGTPVMDIDLAAAIAFGEAAGLDAPFATTLFETPVGGSPFGARALYAIDSIVNLNTFAGPGSLVVNTSSVANPTAIATAEAHALATGDIVTISGHSGSTPSINGSYPVTVTGTLTFTIPVNVSVGGTGGTLTYNGIELRVGESLLLQPTMRAIVDVNGAQTGTITANTLANPTVVTSASHGLVSGDIVDIGSSNSTPTINGTRTVTVTGTNTFTVPVNVTVAGTAGSWVYNTARWIQVAP